MNTNYIFDFDGTLISKLNIDHTKMKNELKNILNLEQNYDLTPMIDKIYETTNDINIINKCMNIIDEYEINALPETIINTEILEMYLRSEYKIIISRNGYKVINLFFEIHNLQKPDYISCRNNVKKLKPNIEHINDIFNKYEFLNNKNICIIGDSWHDEQLAKNINCNYKKYSL